MDYGLLARLVKAMEQMADAAKTAANAYANKVASGR